MSATLTLPQVNPFSTRHVRPGAIEYRFRDDLMKSCENAEQLIDRFEAKGLQGQIVGHHGSGKSTLVATLIPALKRRGYDVLEVTLHAGERRLPQALPNRSRSQLLVVIVDGYEQLSRWNAWQLRRSCARRRFGLLITTHRACMLPLLHETKPSLAVALELFATLFPDDDNRIAPADVEALYKQHCGDMRETLFGLYDLYEARRRRSSR
jgi:hypothetical protein